MSLDLIEKWVSENWDGSIINGGELGINGIATYQPFDGLMDLKVVIFIFITPYVFLFYFNIGLRDYIEILLYFLLLMIKTSCWSRAIFGFI